MKTIPRHKINRWVLPEEYRYRKKSGKKRWKIIAKYMGPNNVIKVKWWHTISALVGKYETQKSLKNH